MSRQQVRRVIVSARRRRPQNDVVCQSSSVQVALKHSHCLPRDHTQTIRPMCMACVVVCLLETNEYSLDASVQKHSNISILQSVPALIVTQSIDVI